MNTFVVSALEKIGYTKDVINCLQNIHSKVLQNSEYLRFRDSFVPDVERAEGYIEKLDETAELCKVNKYSLYLVFLLEFIEKMHADYENKGIEDDIYYDTLCDFKYKLDECVETDNVYGIKPFAWYMGFFRLERFKLGRFQFEFREYQKELYKKENFTLNTADMIINIHIPSCGPMDEKCRILSYERAVKFFKKYFNIEAKAFTVNSWLFYPEHYKFLNPESNIIGFMNEFDIISNRTYEDFPYGWRIFGRYATLPYSELPEDTSLRRDYKKWLISGGAAGSGFGIRIIK